MRARQTGRLLLTGLGGLAALLVAGLIAPSCLTPRPAAAAPTAAPAAKASPASRPAPSAGAKAADPVGKLLTEGWNQLDLVNYPACGAAFEKALASKPTAAQQAEALFGLGHLWQYRQPQDEVKAREYYTRVSEEFRDTPSGPLALLALARQADMPQYEKDRKREQARELYRKVIARYPGHFASEEAVHRLATTYLEELGDPASLDEGVRLLGEHLAKHPDSFLAPVMHLQLGGVCYDRKEYRKAVEHWTTADELDAKAGKDRAMDRSMQAGLYFRIAKVAEKQLQDYPLAIKWYERIVNEIKRDNKFYVSMLSAERCRKLMQQAGGGTGAAASVAPTTAAGPIPAASPASAPAPVPAKEGPKP
jgi:tetratricopeptide (TPR) repeat protein